MSSNVDTPTAPPHPKAAATVVLVRDGVDEVEVFLQRRVQQMAFAGGMTVFPGGGVDPRDAEIDIAWQGPEPSWWAERFGTVESNARQLVCAAVRETFEECGVLLASEPDGASSDATALAPARAALEAREFGLAEFLREQNLVLRADLLRPLAHWITPENEKRRYDTRFFLAALPDGQEADDRTSEVDEAYWRTASGALADWSDGKCFLLPPTWSQLRSVAAYGTVAELLAAERTIEPVQPDLPPGGGIETLSFGDAAEYFASMPATVPRPKL
ncbi:NUDIX hydrolase OS=Tsukamurella paurometabola (strain ATCC 8368 / DSM / CCUG 35730 / CIP 100753/ JCM 10117 / KCTC 9821 / NBRC 16120 / NCIMB 702349 / NCTC 13040) OX=521096 GN=Tpau_2913 PE=4 SV=1 [Tsukamurella paurometabola]|uniref:NUDIX hydrolase n=1 Tax=Tsukamurella paurometabola (strain ATCC 8368 / DSM 20162 / CCUG 35730 / CIP 100753 / JCM 10117 / KCTC 9821 / NBRC 16120 / NCIMB 702349 / NCTC 13040) TaxID=521096 RepID=D5UU08_TSUPD|nr:NUDIX hydrolase [Tsukamurella paurometabola]ADG79511.1 NUDIX hydrolase [Tsukamurella paurometabola DSM 20162]SUP36032.1 NUDIX domain [Tsukamurella paurometabola]